MKKMSKKKKNRMENIVEKNDDVIDLKDEKEVEEKKEKGGFVKSFNIYKFIIKVVATAILLTFGIIMLVKQDAAVFALLLICGLVIALAALIRLFSLFKKDKCIEAKRILGVTCLIHLAIGAYIVIAAFTLNKDLAQVDGDVTKLTGFSKFNVEYFALFVAVVLYTQAVAFFWQTVLYKVNAGKVMFWLHIVYMTLSVVLAFLATNNNVTAKHIVIFLAIIALVCALLIGGEAGYGYFRYRQEMNKVNGKKKEKEDTDKDEKGIEAPSKEEDEINPLIIDEPDAKDQDTMVM